MNFLECCRTGSDHGILDAMIPFSVCCVQLEAVNLRIKGSLTGEGAHIKLNRVYYLSVHTLDNAEGVRYAKNRVSRELLDLWIDKKIGFAGLYFDDSSDSLSAEDAC